MWIIIGRTTRQQTPEIPDLLIKVDVMSSLVYIFSKDGELAVSAHCDTLEAAIETLTEWKQAGFVTSLKAVPGD